MRPLGSGPTKDPAGVMLRRGACGGGEAPGRRRWRRVDRDVVRWERVRRAEEESRRRERRRRVGAGRREHLEASPRRKDDLSLVGELREPRDPGAEWRAADARGGEQLRRRDGVSI